jgi:TolB-like protein/Tfp pilus assembly protein PilF
MSAASPTPHIIRFAAFEVDLSAGELHKHGLRIRLAEQAFQVLAMLLEHPGDLVTRSELRSRLWPDRTYVDFDQGLNKAVNRLRTALGDSAANPRFVETIARRGYRLLVPIAALSPSAPAAPRRIRMAVLPFENLSSDKEQEFFSDGLTEEMITKLGRLSPSQLGIIARTSAMQYKQGGKRIDQIGRELNVDYILEGSVRLEKKRARITVQLIHVGDQSHLWAQSYDRELADIFQVQREVAQLVADSLAFKLLPESHAHVGRANPEAYENYLRGRYFWNRGSDTGAQAAIECFKRALDNDPRYALAHSGTADCYGRLVWFCSMPPLEGGPKAKAAATRALEIDVNLGEGHASMALVRFWYEWNWPEAERELRRATELRPNYADVHNWYAAYLNVMGRFREAASEQKLAEELDPLSLTIAMNAADPYYFARRYDPAIENLKLVLRREPSFSPAHFNLGRAYAQNGMYDEAITAFESAAQLSGNRQASAALAFAYGRAGRVAEARKLLADIERLAVDHYMPAPQLALIHLGLGETEQALDRLEQAFEERSYWMIYLNADPVYDGLRNHPRFIQLLERMGFEPAAAAYGVRS